MRPVGLVGEVTMTARVRAVIARPRACRSMSYVCGSTRTRTASAPAARINGSEKNPGGVGEITPPPGPATDARGRTRAAASPAGCRAENRTRPGRRVGPRRPDRSGCAAGGPDDPGCRTVGKTAWSLTDSCEKRRRGAFAVNEVVGVVGGIDDAGASSPEDLPCAARVDDEGLFVEPDQGVAGRQRSLPQPADQFRVGGVLAVDEGQGADADPLGREARFGGPAPMLDRCRPVIGGAA